MAIQLAPLVMAGGKAALSKLPLIIGAGAALPALREGKPIEAAVQGGLGYLTGMPLRGLGQGLARAASAQAPRLAGQILPDLVDAPGFNVLAKQLARAGVGLGVGLGGLKAGQVIGQSGSSAATQASQALGGAAQTGAGLIGYTAQGQPVYSNIGGAAVPPVGMYGGMSPYGSPLDVLGPAGMGQRLQTIKDAETMRDAMRLLNPEILAASEARSKKEFERNMAAAGIRQNIATRAAMQQRAQQAGLQSGLTAAQQAGAALTNQYQYQ